MTHATDDVGTGSALPPAQPAEAIGHALPPVGGTGANRSRFRTGFTTGSCATAATKAALSVLLNGAQEATPSTVEITLPGGKRVTFPVHRCVWQGEAVLCSVIKDAGDDPDVTHGAEICSTVSRQDTLGLVIDGGEGVGKVTRPGLGLEIGTAAINPVPRQMITAAVLLLAREYLEAGGGLQVIISVPRGEEMAKKTLNARLGIIGGISILGTTGIVKPYSTAAYKASISKAVDVARACGEQTIVLTTGSRSEKFAQALLSLPEEAFVQMGEFTGYGLRDCANKGIKRVVLCGMVGKLAKIADGQMQTHVAGGAVSLDSLAAEATAIGARHEIVEQVRQANTARHFQEIMQAEGLSSVFERICERARQACLKYIKRQMAVEVIMTDFDGKVLGWAGRSLE